MDAAINKSGVARRTAPWWNQERSGRLSCRLTISGNRGSSCKPGNHQTGRDQHQREDIQDRVHHGTTGRARRHDDRIRSRRPGRDPPTPHPDAMTIETKGVKSRFYSDFEVGPLAAMTMDARVEAAAVRVIVWQARQFTAVCLP